MANELKPTTRGIRNHNPLNIRLNKANKWQGRIDPAKNTDGVFEQFETMYYGFRAAIVLLRNYVTRYQLNTISAIITRWAPEDDGNDTLNYIRFVCDYTGIGGNERMAVDNGWWRKVILGMAVVESGNMVTQYKADLDEAWLAFDNGIASRSAPSRKNDLRVGR